MIVFYRLKSDSPNMRKISIMLDEIGASYAVKHIEAHEDSMNDAEFKRISPTQTVPALLDTETGVALFESGAILQYLAEKSGRLLASDLESKAETIKWLMFEAANLCPVLMELHHYIMSDTGDYPEFLLQRYKDKVAQFCQILDSQLNGRDYLVDQYSIADIAIYPWTVALEDLADVDVAAYPNLQAWIERLNHRSENFTATNLALTDWCFENGSVKVCNA